MNATTGEIRDFKPGEPLPTGWIRLAGHPNPFCADCKGTGRTKKIQHVNGVFKYKVCHCCAS